MTLISDYFEKTQKHIEDYGELTIVLMQVGAFFEVYGLKDENNNIKGSNILEFSKICDLNIADKKTCCGKDAIVMAGFKEHLIDRYLKKLQDYGFTIIVYEQDEQGQNTTRSLTGIYSPGTYFLLETEKINNHTCCIWIEIKNGSLKNKGKKLVYIGASVIDIFTGTTSIMEYNEIYLKNPCTFDELERFISIYNPCETIIISNLSNSEINDIVSFTNIKSKKLHTIFINETNNSKNLQRALNCEKQTYQKELLNKFYKIIDFQSFISIFNENVYATQAFCFLLDFIYQHNPNLIYKISEPTLENSNKKLILANHSLKQLNIIEDYDRDYSGKYSSVVKMLNECITPMGKRKFSYNFLNPVTDESYLNNEYDIIEKLLIINNNREDYKNVKGLLVNIKDISKIMRQIMLQEISPKTVYQLYISINNAKSLYNYFIKEKNEDMDNYLKNKINNYSLFLNNTENVLDYLEDVLEIEECKDIENIQKIEKSFIKEGVDTDLDNKIKTLMDSQDQLECCRSYFNSLIYNFETGSKKNNSKVKKKKIVDGDNEEDEEDLKSYVKIHETEKNNFSLLATDRRCKILEELIKNKINVTLKYKSSYTGLDTNFTLSLKLEYIKQSASNKIITNEQITKICKNMASIKVNLIETVSKVYKEIIKNLQEFQVELINISEFITFVDLIYTKVLIADKYNYCKPEIIPIKDGDDKSFIDVKDLRHCLIEKIQQTELYVANDIKIGKGTDKNDELNGILLYGTNAVGKTSLIRALGISVIMAQAGLYVPASNYKYRPYNYIFTRILGNDNLFKGLSTFAVEMSELRTILRLANKNSLVLGDELCSGTESISAISIFVSGIQTLNKLGCSFIFATHIHEIIGYDEIVSLHNVAMKHMSVKYDLERDTLIYNRKLEDGPGTNMYGLEVCKSLSLPEDFLENAHKIRMKYHPESGSILDLKGSHFNAKHIKGGMCEKCLKNPAIDVHHLIFQNEANDKGIIKKKGLSFNKNNSANLINLCESCHDEIHKTNKKYKKTKTTIGITLEEIE
jgi:DNA mismatch repair protein MutS